MKKRKYSNYDPYEAEIGPTMDDGSFVYNNGTGLGRDTSGSGMFDWGGFLSTLLNSGTTVVKSIWGKDDTYRAEAYNTLYEQEKRTNTILWVVIGLVIALGVFLVVRKNK